MSRSIPLLVINSSVMASPFASNEKIASNVFDLSLEELQNVQVSTGSLIQRKTFTGIPITIIHREQIQASSAKNFANILEQYVPGLMLMQHSEGNKIESEVPIAAENYKLLLLVNGINITNNGHEGAILELDLWDMDDIQRIEVVRGPGSVTYGTGAIAGVINIITKPHKISALRIEHVTSIPGPKSNGANAQFATKFDQLSLLSFVSYRRTEGFTSPEYYKWGNNDYLQDPQEYLADSGIRPQIKVTLDLRYGKKLRLGFVTLSQDKLIINETLPSKPIVMATLSKQVK